ncbi:phytanoyl-CoA dioxygenase family protein [Aquihabitans sp. G128]|uniref:phytanoyl-CoA dioxygenase family protein n=1 Tax=Aquihabitans sp. G128 TaxID=2849779 RepID=UPI001C235485|nr:phytanoyl-CoA dioxygenase family protein [Aquihabitans sp. G128]QXC59204.1 phytanoyl-CoA dioxygenase family protein [Aquihabitans sp. G128]
MEPAADHPLAADTAAEAAHFAEHGWVLTRTVDPDGVAELQGWLDEVAAWPDDGDGWMHHRELTDDGPKLCRSENLIPFHTGIRELLTTGSMLATASALLGEPAVLYKEKVNYKLAGGAGYAPHQDAPAYPFIDAHVSCMVAVDDSTVENGCLEVVDACHQEVLAVDAGGCIHPDLVATYDWVPVEVPAGWTLWFHSRTPHRSGPNRSATPRRALYPTYNARSEGDLRADYYAEKLARFAAGGRADGKVQVSLIDDFQGRAV